MMETNTNLSRRKFIKNIALGTGLFCCCQQFVTAYTSAEYAQPPLRVRGRSRALPVNPNNPSIQFHQNRCRNCPRCKAFCETLKRTAPPGEDACIYCGQCTLVCPRALTERFHYHDVARAIADANKIVVVSTAPAIRVALGEMYGLPTGTNVEGKIVASLKKIGVDYVLDVTFSADLTVMEEAAELLMRMDNDYPLPMFTSCCPAWVRYAKLFYPRFLPNFSTVKSPIMMQGALVKTYFAERMGIDPAKIFHVALAPCTAKKSEILLSGMNAAGILHNKPEMRDVDVVLTCRELAYLLNDGNVDFRQIQDGSYNSFMGAGSGAGMIFGNTGGVMEATLRAAYKMLNDKNPPDNFFALNFARGLANTRQATVDMGTRSLNVAIVHGIDAVETVLNSALNFDFVEVMACSGGCIGGGGQPVNSRRNVKQLRMNGLYQHDSSREIRLSNDNPEIKALYNDFLGEPLSEKSKKLLHVKQ